MKAKSEKKSFVLLNKNKNPLVLLIFLRVGKRICSLNISASLGLAEYKIENVLTPYCIPVLTPIYYPTDSYTLFCTR